MKATKLPTDRIPDAPVHYKGRLVGRFTNIHLGGTGVTGTFIAAGRAGQAFLKRLHDEKLKDPNYRKAYEMSSAFWKAWNDPKFASRVLEELKKAPQESLFP